MSEQEPTTYDEFWPFYVRAHTQPLTRRFHFVGTSVGLLCAVSAVLRRKPSRLVAGLAVGYGAAWISHFFIEHNKPATFGHPLWSLRGDFEMLMRMIDGTMDAEVERHASAPTTSVDSTGDSGAVSGETRVNNPPPAGTLH